MLLWHSRKQPKDTPPKRSPWPWRRNRIKSKTVPKYKNATKTLTCMAVNAKRKQKSSQNPPSKRSPLWPCSLNLLPDWQNNGPPLAELYETRMFLRKWPLEGKSPTSTPCTDRAVWADLWGDPKTSCFLARFGHWSSIRGILHCCSPLSLSPSKAGKLSLITKSVMGPQLCTFATCSLGLSSVGSGLMVAKRKNVMAYIQCVWLKDWSSSYHNTKRKGRSCEEAVRPLIDLVCDHFARCTLSSIEVMNEARLGTRNTLTKMALTLWLEERHTQNMCASKFPPKRFHWNRGARAIEGYLARTRTIPLIKNASQVNMVNAYGPWVKKGKP